MPRSVTVPEQAHRAVSTEVVISAPLLSAAGFAACDAAGPKKAEMRRCFNFAAIGLLLGDARTNPMIGG